MNKQETQDLIEDYEAAICNMAVGCDKDPKTDLKCRLEIINRTKECETATKSTTMGGIKITVASVIDGLKKWDDAIWEHRPKNSKKKVKLAPMLNVKACEKMLPAKKLLLPTMSKQWMFAAMETVATMGVY